MYYGLIKWPSGKDGEGGPMVDEECVLRADTIIALEKSRFVAWLKNSDPERILAGGRSCLDCPLRTYLWEVLALAHYPVREVVVYFDYVEVATHDCQAHTPVPAWARRFLHRLAADALVARRPITTKDVRRIAGV